MLTFSSDVVQSICFLFRTGVGVMRNSLLITLHVSTILLEPRPKPTDLDIIHLALVHTAMLLTRVVTVSASAQSLRLLKTDIGCPSICTTGPVSTVISASSSLWAQFKTRVRNNILPTFILLWLKSIVDINVLFNTAASSNVTSHETRFSDGYCSVKLVSSLIVVSLGIMGRSSGYMVRFLFRHSQKVQHLHGQRPPPWKSQETRATLAILLLVSCFGAFYCMDFILSLFLGSSLRNNITLLNANMFVVNGYATRGRIVELGGQAGSELSPAER
ncbi:vomeronasal type-1 receptor 1-like [Tachyglossus aculeatus]|uniref:vomeronasal type-1 receptor 1-like n=1 Tax=Tachyglossus aculeatus TaxID=9261 RepID=UPI0018F4B25B|nr:vomeronasal type-1 receptor 1-like [Tachyglossus aculeatus]